MRGRRPHWLCTVALLVGAVGAPAHASADALTRLTTPFSSALEGGSYGAALALIFVAGLATSLTPCVYPMIAITVSVFGARKAESRARAAMLSTAFVLGIAALFTPLGMVSAITGLAFGSALANPWVIGALALLFFAMALSMFGLFDIALPPALHNRLAQAGGLGLRGAFVLGFVNGLIAAPCTGPVMAVLLTWVATTGHVGFGALSLFLYALGIGVLFWVVGTFAISLPKSGRWLDWTKSAFGIAMLAIGFFYLRALLPYPTPTIRTDGWLLGALSLLIAGLLVGAVHLSFRSGPWSARLRKGVGVGTAVAGLLGIVGWAEALPPGAHIAWAEDYAVAKELALTENRPMLVDFGADWCAACQELDRGPLSAPEVVAEAQRFVTVRVDLSTNEATEEEWALLKAYSQPGLPLVVLHHSDGSEASRVTGVVETGELLQMMTAVR